MFVALSFLKVDKDTNPIVHVSIQQRLKKIKIILPNLFTSVTMYLIKEKIN